MWKGQGKRRRPEPGTEYVAKAIRLVESSWALTACNGSASSGAGTVPSVTSAFLSLPLGLGFAPPPPGHS